MQTTYEAALNEFREASAIVRRAFGAVSEARELQIIADSQHKVASNALAEAQTRLDRADAALSAARAAPAVEAPKAAPAVEAPKAPPVFASFREADAHAQVEQVNAILIDAQANGIGIG